MPEIIITKQTIDTHQALAFMLDGLYPESKRGDTTDHPFELFTEETLHVLDLFIFIRRPFTIHRGPFPFAGLFAFSLKLLIRLDVSIQTFLQDAMDQHVGIPA